MNDKEDREVLSYYQPANALRPGKDFITAPAFICG